MDEDGSLGRRPITDQDAENITRVEELAYELRVREVMTRKLKALTPDMRMSEALELFRTARISGAPVLVNGKLVGIISRRDLMQIIVRPTIEANGSEEA